ncbi:MAG: proline dehydrogenase family protein [Prevotellaceae bacterium]|jgi:proline dehydrogenase|nr:proline dehydrogenase family protein [Prevotellaceae bacterium]
MIDLNNTETAFKIKSNRELKNAGFLFSMIKHPFIVRTLGLMSSLALKIKFPVAWIVKPTLYRHFVGGETIDECFPSMRKMAAENVKSVLDFSVEAAVNEKDIEKTFQELKHSVINSGKHDEIPFSVFKPTALTMHNILKKASESENSLTPEEQISYNNFVQRFDELCAEAVKAGKPIMIDAEDYWFQPAIDRITENMMLKYNKHSAAVYTTLQMYRHDRLDYLQYLIKFAKENSIILGIKYVRGAYMEKERLRAAEGNYPSPVYSTKAETDRAYNKALEISVENHDIIHVFCGTHNEESIVELMQYMKNKGLENNCPTIHISQLYGMSDNLSFNTAKAGYNVAKYLPYGKIKNVLPYLVRRAEENSAIAGQTARELIMLKQELKRRKTVKK